MSCDTSQGRALGIGELKSDGQVMPGKGVRAMFKLSKFTRRTPPPPVPCLKPVELVLFCQWRSGNNCTDSDKRYLCTGVWEKGLRR